MPGDGGASIAAPFFSRARSIASAVKRRLLYLLWRVRRNARLSVVICQTLGGVAFAFSLQAHPPLLWIFLGVALLCQLVCCGIAGWILAIMLDSRFSSTSSWLDRLLALAMLLLELGLSGWMLWTGLHLMHT